MKNLQMRPTQLIVLFLFMSICMSQFIIFQNPTDFVQTFTNRKIKVVSSPIGFKPKAGTLMGKIGLASPISACTQIKQLSLQSEQEDIFLMADDTGCLQSVKARNLAASGTYIGIIKQNINNTLHDREINTVHIPILQIQPNDYDRIVNYMAKNPDKSISIIADFNQQTISTKITLELWLSPTQQNAYIYIISMRDFILNQLQNIQFQPRFVLHSQTNRKQYVGCYSSGRFCPPELQFQGRNEGGKVVGQALRQIIIAQKNVENWLNYAYNFFYRCLKQKGQQLWQQKNSQYCSQSVMLGVDISTQEVFKQFNKSFQGPRPQVDGNILLEKERQLYITQRITSFPIMLVNGKEYALQDPDSLKLRICNMIHPDPNKQTDECKKLTNKSLFTTGQIILILAVFIAALGIIMFLCRLFIYKKMKKQMKLQVDKTLSQYYKYMETLQQPDPSVLGRVPLVEPKIQSNQIGSVELQTYKGSK